MPRLRHTGPGWIRLSSLQRQTVPLGRKRSPTSSPSGFLQRVVKEEMGLADQGGIPLTQGRNSQLRQLWSLVQDCHFHSLEALTLLPPAYVRKLIDQSGSAQEANHSSYFKMQEI